MIIIVEGIDRVGKTTLVNKITENCNVKSFVDSYKKFSFFDYESKKLLEFDGSRNNVVANTEKMNSLVNIFEQFENEIGNILLDRFHLSEFVYGFVDRKYYSLEAFYSLDERLAKLGAIIIYVEPKDVEWSSHQHGSDLKNHLNMFENVLGQTSCGVVRCNFDTLDIVVSKLKERLANDSYT
jgi:negative regulator of sigma E activity